MMKGRSSGLYPTDTTIDNWIKHSNNDADTNKTNNEREDGTKSHWADGEYSPSISNLYTRSWYSPYTADLLNVTAKCSVILMTGHDDTVYLPTVTVPTKEDTHTTRIVNWPSDHPPAVKPPIANLPTVNTTTNYEECFQYAPILCSIKYTPAPPTSSTHYQSSKSPPSTKYESPKDIPGIQYSAKYTPASPHQYESSKDTHNLKYSTKYATVLPHQHESSKDIPSTQYSTKYTPAPPHQYESSKDILSTQYSTKYTPAPPHQYESSKDIPNTIKNSTKYTTAPPHQYESFTNTLNNKHSKSDLLQQHPKHQAPPSMKKQTASREPYWLEHFFPHLSHPPYIQTFVSRSICWFIYMICPQREAPIG